jgi:hypothetical protein
MRADSVFQKTQNHACIAQARAYLPPRLDAAKAAVRLRLRKAKLTNNLTFNLRCPRQRRVR